MHDIPDSSTSVVNLIIMALAVNEWMLYIGGLFAFLDSTSTTMFRSLISKNVQNDKIECLEKIPFTAKKYKWHTKVY